jgi:hypothetical protein
MGVKIYEGIGIKKPADIGKATGMTDNEALQLAPGIDREMINDARVCSLSC